MHGAQWREREKGRERQREREREKGRERQRDREKERKREREKERECVCVSLLLPNEEEAPGRSGPPLCPWVKGVCLSLSLCLSVFRTIVS